MLQSIFFGLLYHIVTDSCSSIFTLFWYVSCSIILMIGYGHYKSCMFLWNSRPSICIFCLIILFLWNMKLYFISLASLWCSLQDLCNHIFYSYKKILMRKRDVERKMVFYYVFTVFSIQNRDIYTSSSHAFCECCLYLKNIKCDYIERRNMSPPSIHCLFTSPQAECGWWNNTKLALESFKESCW